MGYCYKSLIIITITKMIIKKQSKHSPLKLLFFLIFLFHIFTTTKCCSKMIQIRRCFFYVQPQQIDTCNTFKFRKCAYNTINNGTFKWQSKHEWKECLSHCCGLSSANQQYKIQQTCELAMVQRQITSVFFMAGIFTIGVFLICTIYGFIRYRICEKYQRERNNTPEVDNQQPPVSAERFDKDRKEPSRFMKFGDIDCAICFDELVMNNQLIQLMCGHQFHTQCLLQWVNKKAKCPICNDSIFQIRLYCRICMNLLQKYEINDIKLKGILPINCEKCIQK